MMFIQDAFVIFPSGFLLAQTNLFNTCYIYCGTIPDTLKPLINFFFFRLTAALFNKDGNISFGMLPLLYYSFLYAS